MMNQKRGLTGWVPNNLQKLQSNPSGPNNRQEAPVPTS